MSNRIERTALITGGTRGIGYGTASLLAEQGYKLSLVYNRDDKAAQVVQKELINQGASVITFKADVADEDQMTQVFANTKKQLGGIDVVINSAGIMRLAPIANIDWEALDAMHRTNIRGSFIVNHLATNHVRKGGAIINLTTSVKKLAFPQYAGYAASKAAVEAMVPILAKELRGRDITVNCVAPGPTATDFFLKGKDEATIEKLSKAAPLERLGTPEDIAEVIAFLAGPCRWINGQVIYTNGGII
ncbi:SDR family oxidoreductase [Spirochaeta cellobiosiphila]|uniref:SDR family oxidoreductase n=1 Tax=Spirochaeta cellobiosiphila TaxID=504483 RepID=UPI00040ADC50|nr:SDR family oxidoreductase [Spirochaeta cellobiosiphila]